MLIPDEIPVMTLSGAVLFPHALMPLHIFEKRYRQMLKEVLAGKRLFAIANLDTVAAETTGLQEPPHEIATVGVVRACQGSLDGTSNLVLQGVMRVRILGIVQEEPYRVISIAPLKSEAGLPKKELLQMKGRLLAMIHAHQDNSGELSSDLIQFLETIQEPEIFIDLVAFAVPLDSDFKQKLLSTLSIPERYQILIEHLRNEIDGMIFDKKLRGNLSTDDIIFN